MLFYWLGSFGEVDASASAETSPPGLVASHWDDPTSHDVLTSSTLPSNSGELAAGADRTSRLLWEVRSAPCGCQVVVVKKWPFHFGFCDLPAGAYVRQEKEESDVRISGFVYCSSARVNDAVIWLRIWLFCALGARIKSYATRFFPWYLSHVVALLLSFILFRLSGFVAWERLA